MAAPRKDLMFGVFLPLGKGGWIISKNAPEVDASYALNRTAAVLADRLGFDFVLSMMKWRGFGGETNHWGVSLESITLMAGLAEATKRVKIWCTAHTLLHHPVVIAKMMATIDQISHGRAGLNIVSGADRVEFERIGVWRPDLDHDRRYDLAREWIEIITRLWSEPRVSFKGEFFSLDDVTSDPKPVSVPRPDLICAGVSEAGLTFTAKYADAAFIAGRTEEEQAALCRRAKQIAHDHGRSIKTFSMCVVVPGATDAEAERRVAHFGAGVDHAAVDEMSRGYGRKPDGGEISMVTRARRSGFMATYFAGSAATLRQKIAHMIEAADLDGMMLIFPDYVEDLRFFGENVLPDLRRVGAPAAG